MFQHKSHVSTQVYVSQCSGEADLFGHFLSFTCLRHWLLNRKVFPQSLQAYFSIALCISLWDSRFRTSGFSYEQSGHLCMIPSCSLAWQVKSPLFLNFLLQFRYMQQWVRRVLWLILCLCRLLSKAKRWSQSSHLNFSSLCEYWCLANDNGLLNAFEHTSQYRMLCFHWWCWISALVEAQTASHIRQLNLWAFLLFFNP